MKTISLTGHDLSLDDVVAVARDGATAILDPAAVTRMSRSRAVVDFLVTERVKVYGLTTGFGSKKNVFIEPEQTRKLQENLIQSHSCGVGSPFDEDVVRATILLRANTLARGISGIRVEVVEALLSLLRLNIFPFIPAQGSLGASGDLTPLSHLALVLTGDPRGRIYRRQRLDEDPSRRRGVKNLATRAHASDFGPSSRAALAELRFTPISLEAKEGLALNNGTQVMNAVGLLTVADTLRLIRTSEGAAAMSFEALKGVSTAFAAELHDARPHQGQRESAAALRAYTAGSQILAIPLNMAYVNAATRSMQDAIFHLEAEAAPRAEAIVDDIRGALAMLDALRAAPEDPIADGSNAFEALGAYRRALEPTKHHLLSVYRALLATELSDEGQQAQRHLASSLSALEAAVPTMPRVQDSYSLRCSPQVIGAVRGAVEHVRSVLMIEANSATDNPLIFSPEFDSEGRPLPLDDLEAYRAKLEVDVCRECVRSGGNFHGEPVAIAMDYLSIAVSELANISERRVAHMVDGHLNLGLPSLLIHRAGLNSGFMIPQYTAAALVSENKAMAHPASVDSIPSCENTEDHVSMGTIAARKAREILNNAEEVIAIELLTGFQALFFRRPLRAGDASRALCELLGSAGVEFVSEDRPLYLDMERVASLVRTGAVAERLGAFVA